MTSCIRIAHYCRTAIQNAILLMRGSKHIYDKTNVKAIYYENVSEFLEKKCFQKRIHLNIRSIEQASRHLKLAFFWSISMHMDTADC